MAGSPNNIARPTNHDEQRVGRTAVFVGFLLLISCIVWLASWGSGGALGPAEAMAVVLIDGACAAGLAGLWLTSAFGWGQAIVALYDRRDDGRNHIAPAIALAAGVATQLILVSTFGRLGVLDAAGGTVAWGIVALPLVWLSLRLAHRWKRAGGPITPWPHWLVAATAPVLAIAIIAALTAPGWLWASEFGGYDAMSYHLQLPREWLAFGAITGVEHNVYSFMPGYVEAAYYHLMVMSGDDVSVFTAAQILHLLVGMSAAWALATFVRGCAVSDDVRVRRAVGAVAAVLLITTPWVFVVGTLAYNELFVLLMLVGAMHVAVKQQMPSMLRGGVIGLLCAAACGAKLTAVGFVVAPVTAVIIMRIPRSQWLATLGVAAATGLIALSPWLIGNLLQTGNPFFPFLTSTFGTAHWTAEQAVIWAAAHAPDAPLQDRMTAIWNQWLRYGVGANPKPGEPWLPHWSILPWLGVAGLVVLLARRDGATGASTDRTGLTLVVVLAVQIMFWLGATHLQSRFLLPAAVPLAAAGALAFRPAVSAMVSSTRRQLVLAALMLALSAPGIYIYFQQRDGEPARMMGATATIAGRALTPAERRGLADVLPHMYINHVLNDTAHVLLIGEAAPLYFRLDRMAYQTTWDRGPLSMVIAAAPDAPNAWPAGVADRGFTHVLIRPDMLRIWLRDGWGDSQLDPDKLVELFNTHATLQHEYASGVRLYALPLSVP